MLTALGVWGARGWGVGMEEAVVFISNPGVYAPSLSPPLLYQGQLPPILAQTQVLGGAREF